MAQAQALYGVFYRSNGRLTKTPYMGEVYTASGLKHYFKNYADADRRELKVKLHVRKVRNGKRH